MINKALGIKLSVIDEVSSTIAITALQNLIDQGNNIKTIATNGRPWVEIDFPEDFEVAKKLF